MVSVSVGITSYHFSSSLQDGFFGQFCPRLIKEASRNSKETTMLLTTSRRQLKSCPQLSKAKRSESRLLRSLLFEVSLREAFVLVGAKVGSNRCSPAGPSAPWRSIFLTLVLSLWLLSSQPFSGGSPAPGPRCCPGRPPSPPP